MYHDIMKLIQGYRDNCTGKKNQCDIQQQQNIR